MLINGSMFYIATITANIYMYHKRMDNYDIIIIENHKRL